MLASAALFCCSATYQEDVWQRPWQVDMSTFLEDVQPLCCRYVDSFVTLHFLTVEKEADNF